MTTRVARRLFLGLGLGGAGRFQALAGLAGGGSQPAYFSAAPPELW